jgi:excisionase family DNA binding protein
MTKKTELAALPQLLTLQESAQILKTSMKTLRRRIDDGQLPVIRDGRIVCVHPADLQRYIAARRSL